MVKNTTFSLALAFCSFVFLINTSAQAFSIYVYEDKAELVKARENINKAIKALNDNKENDAVAKNHIDDAIQLTKKLPKNLSDKALVHLEKALGIVNSNGKDKTAIGHLKKALGELTN